MTEGEAHIEAVARTKFIIRLRGDHVLQNSDKRGLGGFELPPIFTPKGVKQWTVDNMAQQPDGRRYIVEVDGHKPGQGHGTAHNMADDGFRDRFLQEYFGITTVRLWTTWLVGKGALTNDEIRKEIDFWLSKALLRCQH